MIFVAAGHMLLTMTTQDNHRPLLDWLLAKFPDVPKKRAKQWITAGRVNVNGIVVRKPHQLMSNPGVALKLLDRQATTLDCGRDGWQIHTRVNLMYLDSALAIVNKGPGLLSLSAAPDDLSAQSILSDFLSGKLHIFDRTLVERTLPAVYRRLKPLPVHRLDQYTSGVFCMAMNSTSRASLIELVSAHKMQREYVAYVEGRLKLAQGTWRNWLKLSEDELRQVVVLQPEAEAVEAITHYEVIAELEGVTKLRLKLETGRKHQIRAQAAFAGAPLIGDRTYNPRRRIEFPRQALHAETLSFEHGEKMTWKAAMPGDLQQLEASLRRR